MITKVMMNSSSPSMILAVIFPICFAVAMFLSVSGSESLYGIIQTRIGGYIVDLMFFVKIKAIYKRAIL
ncbi:hypothetical protein [Pontibacter fetidus]|uniref:hypothetical protein n=1 Tax=Pontibacter fetidus TaxID=2700082 RepID=UPI001390DB45|nr:hypothetical protein [Pontibacter fetidus]